MRANDLDLMELMDLESSEGAVRFAGRRALILDAAAIGLLRRQLVDVAGWAAARAVLTRFGYYHGFRMAEAMRAELSWDNDDEWREAGGLIHTLQGCIRMAPGSPGPLSPEGATLAFSFEAEQHVLFFGRADAPVCWMLAGFASGYMSCTESRPMRVLEDRCVARGDAACHFVGRPVEAGDAEPEPLPEALLRRASGPLEPIGQGLPASGDAPARGEDLLSGIVAKSPKMRRAVDLARSVARTDATVLVTGESGAGKERIARLVHEASARAAGPFVAVNCAAVAEALFESELFGHARGAFTGAARDRIGLFEAASGGTLLLDEIGDVPLGAQAKLLRALEERQVRRVGENLSRRADARVIAATNRDLVADVAAGRFREDLYYRLNVVEIPVPPLRERREDVLLLARALLAGAARRAGRKIAGLSPPAVEALLRYGWPGNVRELENAMARAAALAQGKRVDLSDLPESVLRAPPAASKVTAGVRPIEAIEREHILAALEANGGNRAKTAAQLGIGASTLYRRLRGYAVSEQPPEPLLRGRRHDPAIAAPPRAVRRSRR